MSAANSITKTLKRVKWRVLNLSVISVYIAANIGFIVFTLPPAVILYPFRRFRIKVISVCLRCLLYAMFVKIAPLIGYYKLDAVENKNLFNRKNTIYVCNHTSLIDPLIALALIPDAAILLKSKYSKWLAIWYLIRVLDFVEIKGVSPADLLDVTEKSKEILEGKRNMIIFPEGTRSASERVMDFKNFAFKLAKESNREIVAMCICSQNPFFAKNRGGLLPAKPTRFHIEAIGTINPADYKDTDTLCGAAHRIVSKRVRLFHSENPCEKESE